MRSRKNRRRNPDSFRSSLENNGSTTVAGERRKLRDRRIENLDDDERQLMFSEMPSPTRRKPT